MQRIIHHSELVEAPCLLPFFTANPNDWDTIKAHTTSSDDGTSKREVDNDDDDPNTIKIDARAAMHSPLQENNGATKRDQWALQKKNLLLEETPAESKKI